MNLEPTCCIDSLPHYSRRFIALLLPTDNAHGTAEVFPGLGNGEDIIFGDANECYHRVSGTIVSCARPTLLLQLWHSLLTVLLM